METESYNWICFAKLLTDVGAEVLRNVLNQNIPTCCLGEYKSFWLKTLETRHQFNFCSILWLRFFQQVRKLDQDKEEELKPLIESLKPEGKHTLAKQVEVLKTWMHDIQNKLDSCETNVQEMLSSWEREIKDEVCKVGSLLGVLKDWNTSFFSLWNKYENDLISKMEIYLDEFVSTRIKNLSNIKNSTRDALQTFSITFEKDAQSIKEKCQKELMICFKSWQKHFKAVVNSWSLQEKIPDYNHILESLVSEVKVNLPRLKERGMTEINRCLESWYTNLRKLQASWQRQTDVAFDSPTKITKLAQTWKLNLDELPSYHQEQLKRFFHSKRVLRTLIGMWKHKIIIEDDFNAFPDLRALDTTCLLILLRTNGILQPPDFGWQGDTSDTDLSVAADLLRLESYRNDMVRGIENQLIPVERVEQVKAVLSRLASHCGKDFRKKVKTDMDNINTCIVEEAFEDPTTRGVLNSCRRAILADLSGLSLSGRSMAITSTFESYTKILRSLLFVKRKTSNPSEEIENTDEKNWNSEVDDMSKDNEKYQRQLLEYLLDHLVVNDTDQEAQAATITHPDFREPLPFINMMPIDVSQSAKIDSIPQTAKRFREEEGQEQVKKHIKKSHQCPTADLTNPSTSAGTYVENNILESGVDSRIYSRTAGLVLENDNIKVLELLRSNNIKCIEDILREHTIPTKHLTITAINECGYNTSIQYLLKRMSGMLKDAIPNSVGSWCGYRPQDPNCPVFVVTLGNPNYVFDKNEMLKPFLDYEIIMRCKNVPNEEEKTILEKTGERITRGEDDARVHLCIAQNTESLMREHSNLSIIRANCVKARGYIKKNLQLVEETCIVFSVPVKGIIPIGEKEFQKSINGIVTDVREGEFVLFTRHNANRYHHQLRMGCCISRPETNTCGTLGGFIDLPDGKIGCLTAAHVVLTKEEIEKYIIQVESRSPINEALKNGQLVLTTYQPDAIAGICFGNVCSIALQDAITSPSVDAAIIAITNDNRNPEAGNFPEGDFSDVGFPIDDPMMYNSGKILDPIPSSQRGSAVLKFGIATGISRGFLGWHGTSARVVFEWGNYCFPAMFGQLEIVSPGFATYGDSGALAFMCYGGNVDNLHAIGMVIGGSSTGCSTLITPIRTVFQELGLSENRFKVFHPRILPNVGQTSQDIADSVNRHGHVLDEHREALNNMSGRITTMDININQRVDILEQRIKDEMTKGFQDIKQFMLANPR